MIVEVFHAVLDLGVAAVMFFFSLLLDLEFIHEVAPVVAESIQELCALEDTAKRKMILFLCGYCVVLLLCWKVGKKRKKKLKLAC